MSENPISHYLNQSIIIGALLRKILLGMNSTTMAYISWDVEIVDGLSTENYEQLRSVIRREAEARHYAVVMGSTQGRYIVSWSKIQDTPMSIEDAVRGVKYTTRKEGGQ